MLGITADPLWAENMEDIAFNSFPRINGCPT